MHKKLILITSFSVISFGVNSGTMGPIFEQSQYTPLATITIGPDVVNPGHAQTLTLLPPFQNHYTKGSASQAVVDVGGFVGVERAWTEKMSVQFGFSGYWDSSMTAKGDVWQFALPVFDSLGYTYRIHHSRVMASTKLLTTQFNPSLHPYVSGEIGVAFNQASGYQETPLEAGAVPTAPFANHSQTAFAWGIGLGFDYNLTKHMRLGAGYQFSDLGQASLGATSAALTTQSLSLSHLYANQFRFQLTILA